MSHTLSLSPTYLATPMQAKLTFKLHKAKLMFKLHNQVQQNALFRTTEVLCRCWIKLRSGWGMAGFCVFIGVTVNIQGFFGSFYSPYINVHSYFSFFKQESCKHQNLLVTGLLGWVAVKRLFEVCSQVFGWLTFFVQVKVMSEIVSHVQILTITFAYTHIVCHLCKSIQLSQSTHKEVN